MRIPILIIHTNAPIMIGMPVMMVQLAIITHQMMAGIMMAMEPVMQVMMMMIMMVLQMKMIQMIIMSLFALIMTVIPVMTAVQGILIPQMMVRIMILMDFAI